MTREGKTFFGAGFHGFWEDPGEPQNLAGMIVALRYMGVANSDLDQPAEIQGQLRAIICMPNTELSRSQT